MSAKFCFAEISTVRFVTGKISLHEIALPIAKVRWRL